MRIGQRGVRVVIASGALVVGCGGSSTDNPFSQPDAGDASVVAGGGTSAGGSVGSAGTGAGGSPVGSGGFVAGTGGTTSAGGTPGSGGAAGAPSSGCAAPADRNQTAVCVTLVPESITAQSDPTLDKKGVLLVQIFDTPTPPEKDASSVALVERVVPANPGTAEVSLDAVAMQRLVGTLPPVAYVRAVFVDNAARLAPDATLGWGAWIGGVNVADGFQDKDPIVPVKLTVGAGNAVSLPLVALRKLTVKVHASATPIGDGQGPLAAVVVDNPDVAKKPPAFGVASARCADIAKDVTLTGFVVGKGPYWVTGALNDLGLPGDFPPGTLAALSVAGGKITIPQQLVIAAGDYAPSVSIDLSYAAPLSADAGPVPPNSCADLITSDGGLPEAGP